MSVFTGIGDIYLSNLQESAVLAQSNCLCRSAREQFEFIDVGTHAKPGWRVEHFDTQDSTQILMFEERV